MIPVTLIILASFPLYFFTYFTSAPYRVIAYTEVKRTQSMGPVLPISLKESAPFILKSNEETK